MICSDWEGPWVLADHAFEVTKRGIPFGDRLFAGISEYDDYLSYIRKKEGYEPGDTLALIAPFLIAYDVKEKLLDLVAADNAVFIRGSFDAIQSIREDNCPLRIVSTSYCQYVKYTTSIAGIPFNKVKCTEFPLTCYEQIVKDSDKRIVKQIASELIELPSLGISSTTKETELSENIRVVIKKLDEFFWLVLPETSYKEILEQIKPIGGSRKFQALKIFLEEEKDQISNCVTIGDSITDWVMLKETKEAGGLAISFNGNDYAIRNSNMAIISDSCYITALITNIFCKGGIKAVERVTSDWSKQTLKEAEANRDLDSRVLDNYLNHKGAISEAKWITKDNIEQIVQLSKKYRKKIRGYSIGSLG